MSLLDMVAKIWALTPSVIKGLYYRINDRWRLPINRVLFPEKKRVVEVQSGLLKGMKMSISPHIEKEYYFGTYEPDMQQVLPRLITKGMTVYNLGANIGFFTLILARLVGPNGQVIAFECSPTVVVRLRENISLNRLENVMIEPFAVGDVNGEVSFSFSLSDTQRRFIDLPYVPKESDAAQVPCLTIDSYIRTKGLIPQVIVMDVEHAEGRVLKGMNWVLRTLRPLVILEMHGAEAIAEAYQELCIHHYSLMILPSLKPVYSIENIVSLSHYLACPPGFKIMSNCSKRLADKDR